MTPTLTARYAPAHLAALVIAALAMCACSRPPPAQTAQSAAPAAPDKGYAYARREIIKRTGDEERTLGLVAKGDYPGLDDVATDLRTKNTVDPDGLPSLQYFHDDLAYGWGKGDPKKDCAVPFEAVAARWLKAKPASPTAIVVHGELIIHRAWCVRGHDFADKVAPQAWAPFLQRVEEARAYLEANKSVGSADPEWFADMEDIAQLQDWDEARFMALVDEGTHRYPLYYRLYDVGMEYFSPRWHGDNEKMDAYARAEMNKTAPLVGTDLYARLYRGIFELYQLEDMKADTAVDWDLMKTSMEGLVRRYPDEWNADAMARMACYADDQPEKMKLVRIVHPTLEYYGNSGETLKQICG
jgi:hypothetical protein